MVIIKSLLIMILSNHYYKTSLYVLTVKCCSLWYCNVVFGIVMLQLIQCEHSTQYSKNGRLKQTPCGTSVGSHALDLLSIAQ